MNFLAKIFSGVVTNVLQKGISWLYSFILNQEHLKNEKDKNKEAIEKVKNSVTEEEIDEALDAISHRTTDK